MRIAGIEMHSGPGHTAWALTFMAAVALTAAAFGLPQPWWAGAAYGAAFYHGREQRDAETVAGETGKVMGPWQWHAKSQWDFWLPAVACLIAALALEVVP